MKTKAFRRSPPDCKSNPATKAMVRAVRLELPLPYGKQILSLLRTSAGRGTRTLKSLPTTDFETAASTNSATGTFFRLSAGWLKVSTAVRLDDFLRAISAIILTLDLGDHGLYRGFERRQIVGHGFPDAAVAYLVIGVA